VDLAAPGVSVLSCLPGNNYASWSGTSMATPHVSGVAALLMSQNPSWSVDEIKTQILGTVDLLPALADKVVTGGRLNATSALGAPALPPDPDSTAPAEVTDLAASPISPSSVTLTWTAPGDDGNTGRAYAYDIRYSRNPINTDEDFAAALQAPDEPNPQNAGAEESFTLQNLSGNTDWYFAIKTFDESGNASPLSNLASAITPTAPWQYVTVGWGDDVGNFASVDVLSNGYWAAAWDDKAAGVLKCSMLVPPGYGFIIDTVAPGGFGPSVAFSPAEEVSISHVDSAKRLWFAIKSGSSWTSTQLEPKNVNPYETSMAYNGTDPAISYYKTGHRSSGLYVAQRSGSVWTTQQVDPGAAAVYNQLAVGPAGDLTVAYSGGNNGDTLKVARYDGSTWNISAVEVGGSYATVAYDFVSGYPALAHVDPVTGQLRFLRWNGTGWTSAEIVDTGSSITGCSLAFGPNETAYLAYGSTDGMHVALRAPDTGVWTTQVFDDTTSGSLRNSYKGRPFGTPSGVAYGGPASNGYASSVRLAIRRVAY